MAATQEKQYIVFYGSLMEKYGKQDALGIRGKIQSIGQCELPGILYDLGEYPGLIQGVGIVYGELFELTDVGVLKQLDQFEHFFPEDCKNSMYIRTDIRLLKPDIKAWVYIYNQNISDKSKISSGNWNGKSRSSF